MRVLVLGGTRFLGRALVDATLEQGHEPTLFNRGQTNPELFPDVEKLRGDRSSDLSALEGREWDAVLDVAPYMPDDVRSSVDALRGRVGRYVFVSSISVYADMSEPPDEDGGRPRAHTRVGGRRTTTRRTARAKQPASRSSRRLSATARSSSGRGSSSGRTTRPAASRTGPIGSPVGVKFSPPAIRTMRRSSSTCAISPSWIVRATANGLGGTFNATGDTMRLGDLLEECRVVTGSDATFTWVPSNRLMAEEVGPWMELPLWLPLAPYAAMLRAPVERAKAAGLIYRPLADTIQGTLDEAEPVEGVGLTPSGSANCSPPPSVSELPWTSPEWLSEATAWIRERADVAGDIEQPHVRWWSTVLRVPTTDGDLYFKAVSAIHVFEAALTGLLAELQPRRVPELVAMDAKRGWMLMRDGGTRLRELVDDSAPTYTTGSGCYPATRSCRSRWPPRPRGCLGWEFPTSGSPYCPNTSVNCSPPIRRG